MSLQVWLPLTKDLRQQGLNERVVTNTGATYSSTGGNLGGCYIFDGTDDALAIGNLSTLVTNDFSFACWFYHDETWSSKSYETILGGPSGFELEGKNSSTNSPVLKAYSWGGGTITYELNRWNHLVMTRTTSETKFYLNGELKLTGSAGSIPSGDYFVGAWKTSAQQNYKGKLCDVRIYDHCLSLMEVKQISQGLLLHYPLNRNSFGQDNLATCTNTTQYNLSATSGNYNYFWANNNTLEPNTTYTFSAEVTVSDNITKCTVYNYTASGKAGSINSNFPADGKRHSWTFTTTADAIGFICYAGIAGSTTNHTATYKNIKIEKGDKATPYTPRIGEDLYEIMGLDEIIEYDCSGFCNNGTRTGTFTWTSDTPKYTVSQNCLGTNYIYLTPPSTEIQTMAVWVKWNSIPSGQSVILVDNGSGIGLGLYSGGILCSTSGAGSSYAFSKANLVANTWYHFVVVKTGATTRKLYINGVEQTANSSSSNWSYSVDQLQLGKRSTTSDGFVGKLSDFRAYVTALSADDVKSLYQNSAYIDSSGNVYGAVHMEA